MLTRLLFVHALSPLHAGTGQGIGTIDLPIAREKATNIPYLPGSSLKGALRDRCEDGPTRAAVFGPETTDHAGAVQFADARLVLLPVRSLAGTFAYVTSPYLLKRLARDASDLSEGTTPSLPTPTFGDNGGEAYVDEGTVLSATLKDRRVVGLEDLDLDLKPSQAATDWARWLEDRLELEVRPRLCVVHDDVMGFLLETATEVVARIKLEEKTKTVSQGGLWYEESLPAETVLVSLVLAGSSRERQENGSAARLSAEKAVEVVGKLTEGTVQLGGKATVGRGLCRLRLG